MNVAEKPDKIHFKNGIEISNEKVWLKINNTVIRYLYEIFNNIFYIILLKIKYKNNTYVWIDPLNAFAWVIMRKLWFLSRSIFYTPDYSPKKFSNTLLNKIYHWIDKFSVKYSDETWNISSRVTELREQLNYKNKNVFLPNVPWLLKITKDINYEKYSIITSWSLKSQLDHKKMIDVIKKIKINFPDVRYYIAWDGEKREELENHVKTLWLEDTVIFLWFLKYSEYIEIVARMWVWVALYTGSMEFNYYWDSTKCREFMHFWMPILTTDFHSTAKEINDFNVWIVHKENITINDYAKSLTLIFEKYDDYAKNSRKLWEKYNSSFIKKIDALWN